MPQDVIRSADEVTPEWLTATLRAGGVLTRGEVAGVEAEGPESTFASDIYRLAVTYTAGAFARAPRHLFLKISMPSLQHGALPREQWRREYDFYTGIAPAMNAHVTIPAFGAGYEENTGASYLLLLDVSDTHGPCLAPEEAPVDGGPLAAESAVEALARFHAAWWDSPRLGVDIGRYPSPQERIHDVENARIATATFFDRCGDSLPDRWRATYERVLDALPGLYGRHSSGRNLTLVHGDAHLGNFLFPRRQRSAGPPASRPAHVAGPPSGALLLDWQFWHPTIGGTDLAFLIARWEPETRRALEAPLLHRYHDGLLAHGVTGYTRSDCYDDYRLSVILVSLFIPIWQRTLWGWKPDLRAVETVMTAYEELGCEEMLGRVQ